MEREQKKQNETKDSYQIQFNSTFHTHTKNKTKTEQHTTQQQNHVQFGWYINLKYSDRYQCFLSYCLPH